LADLNQCDLNHDLNQLIFCQKKLGDLNHTSDFFKIMISSNPACDELYQLLLVSDHPNKEQYDQYEQQWRQYEEQMSQKREYIQSRKRSLLESQQQGQAAAAASQPAVAPPDSSIAAPVPPFAATSAFSAPASAGISATHTPAMYGAVASTQLATSQPVQSGYSYPGGPPAGQPYPMPAPGYGSHLPGQPGVPYPPRMGPSVPGGQRFPGMPHDTSAFPPANSGPGGPPRPGFPGARPPFGAGQAPAGVPSENQEDFEQYGDSENSAAGSQFLQGSRPPFEAAGGRPPFGQQFRGPRPGAPNEFGMQAPFRPNQPRVGFGQGGPRPGFAPDMYVEGGESSADQDDVTESGDQTADVASSQFGPGFGGTGFGRGMRPGLPGMGPRAGFPRGPRPMGMMLRPQAPGFLEETGENTEESDGWLGDGMPATSGAEFIPRGIRPEGPRFTTPASGFSGRGDIRGPGPRPGDPRLMLRPGDPRAVMPGGLRPRGPGLPPPWLAGSGRGAPQWGQNLAESATDEEYDENAENQDGLEDVGDEEGFGGDYEGDQDLQEEDVGFGNAGFGPHGFPPSQFGTRPPGFGMERPRLDMRLPRPGFGLRGPGFGAGLRPRTGPVPLMDIRVRAPPAAQSINKDELGIEQEGEENVADEKTEALAEDADPFAKQADVTVGMGARMPFRPPFVSGLRGFPPDQRLRTPGSMLGAPPRGGAPWPRSGFGERPMSRFPVPGFRGPLPRFPRMLGPQFDSDPNQGYYPEDEGFDVETGFGDVPDEDYLAAEAEQWGDQQPNQGGQLMKPGGAGDASAER